MADYLKTGVNRLSIGLQSADEGELRILGRIHTWKEFLKTYEEARKAGCDNINIDLMSAIPGRLLIVTKGRLRRYAVFCRITFQPTA